MTSLDRNVGAGALTQGVTVLSNHVAAAADYSWFVFNQCVWKTHNDEFIGNFLIVYTREQTFDERKLEKEVYQAVREVLEPTVGKKVAGEMIERLRPSCVERKCLDLKPEEHLQLEKIDGDWYAQRDHGQLEKNKCTKAHFSHEGNHTSIVTVYDRNGGFLGQGRYNMTSLDRNVGAGALTQGVTVLSNHVAAAADYSWFVFNQCVWKTHNDEFIDNFLIVYSRKQTVCKRKFETQVYQAVRKVLKKTVGRAKAREMIERLRPSCVEEEEEQ